MVEIKLQDYNEDDEKISQAKRAYNAIREAILDLKLKPGQPLSEIELATQLNMSRTPVREAIRQLENEELVEIIPRKGSFVKVLSGEEIKQIYEIAEGLEAMVAYLVVQRHDTGGLNKLLECVEGMEKALRNDDIEEWIRADEKFHENLRNQCDNELLVNYLNKIDTQVHRVRIMSRRILSNREESTREHREAYEKIASGNAAGTRDLMHQHWERVRNNILKIVYPLA